VLSPERSLPDGMVRVTGGGVSLGNGPSFPLEDFLIDQFEVTNRAFKAFVEAGGLSAERILEGALLEKRPASTQTFWRSATSPAKESRALARTKVWVPTARTTWPEM
jgi:formylglycine-generating enzyme required for sulfatase activity